MAKDGRDERITSRATLYTNSARFALFPCAARSNVPRNGPDLRRGTTGKVEDDLVHVAPAPALGRIVTLDDRVPGRLKCAVAWPVGRVVAATDVSAGSA